MFSTLLARELKNELIIVPRNSFLNILHIQPRLSSNSQSPFEKQYASSE